MKKATVLFMSLMILTGCTIHNGKITEEEFLNDTTIEYVLYDADITNWDAFNTEYITNNIATFDINEVYLNDLVDTIDEYDYIQLTEFIDVSSYGFIENSRFFVIPVFNTWHFDDVDFQYSFEDGHLVFSVHPVKSNFPTTTLKILVIHVESIHSYQAAIMN
jgi:hypothetical protein